MSVEITSSAHDGMTDLVVGYGGIAVLVEVKDGNKVPSKRKLTTAQVKFNGGFKGGYTVIETVDQAIALVNEIRKVQPRSKLTGIWGR